MKAVKNWPEPKSVKQIQMFLGFTNFYQRFIQGFSKKAASLTSMLNTIGSADTSALIPIVIGVNEVVSDGGHLKSLFSKSKKTNSTKSKILAKSKNFTNVGTMEFLTSKLG